MRRLRWVLPSLAGFMAAIVAGQLAWRAAQGLLVREPPPDSTARMVNPSFSGQGRDGSRYLVTAQSGVRDPKDAERILLDKPAVTISPADGPATRTASQRGVFRQNDMTLHLQGQVQGERPGGDRFAANDVIIDTATGEVRGANLTGQGASGGVRADSYAIYDSGKRMVLRGGVRARLTDGR